MHDDSNPLTLYWATPVMILKLFTLQKMHFSGSSRHGVKMIIAIKEFGERSHPSVAF